MKFISPETLRQEREAGHRPSGGLCENSSVLESASLSPSNIKQHIERLDQLLKERWNHPADTRILFLLEEVFGEGYKHSVESVDRAATHVWFRDRGDLLGTREEAKANCDAYEGLCFAVMQRCVLRSLSL